MPWPTAEPTGPQGSVLPSLSVQHTAPRSPAPKGSQPLEGELRTHLGQCSPEQGGGLHLGGRTSPVGRTGLAREGAGGQHDALEVCRPQAPVGNSPVDTEGGRVTWMEGGSQRGQGQPLQTAPVVRPWDVHVDSGKARLTGPGGGHSKAGGPTLSGTAQGAGVCSQPP